MRPDFLDRHSRLDSPIHRLPASVKLLAAVALVLATVVTPPSAPVMVVAVALVLVVAAALSRVPWRFVVGRVLLLEPFVVGVAILALFQADGWRLFVFLLAKCTVCLVAMVLLASTTPFSELLRVLAAVRVPGLLLTTLALMYRYLFVLADETGRMNRARASRTFQTRRRTRWKTASTVVSQLFVRSSERADRIYAAMCARGWR